VLLFSLLQRLPPFRRIGASRIHVHAFIETKCHLGREIKLRLIVSWDAMG
jgi:hypothetical protein